MTKRDGLVAGLSGFVMCGIAVVDATGYPQPSDVRAATTLGALAVAHASLAFRSARPRAVVMLTAIGAAIVAGTGFTVPVVALPLALYSLAASASATPAWVTGMAVAGSSALLAAGHTVGSDDASSLWVRDTALGVAAVAVGAWATSHRQAGRRLAEADAARQVAADRLALSRELHDLAAGTLTAVAVQAGAAEHLGDRRPDLAKAMMGDVAAESRAAMARLREMAAALRAGEVPGSRPRPAAETVDGLVELYRRAGLVVRGSWGPVTGGGDGDDDDDDGDGAILVRLVVQEALTNALRHAGRVDVDLSVCDQGGFTVVEVVNPLVEDGPTAGRPGEGGIGLAGLRERIEQAGGTLEHGADDGRFRVRAAVPSVGL